MRTPKIPPEAEIIRTFDELREFRDSFFQGELSFLLLVGRPGLSKSWEFKDRCKPRRDADGNELSAACYFKGNITAARAYRLAYENRDRLLVLDDAERLWQVSNGRILLRDLTEGTSEKRITWQVDNKELERDGIPKSFVTRSRVSLIMNRCAFGSAEEYDAIVDRAHFVYFDPFVEEIHKNAAIWFWDQEIFDFIGRHLPLIDKGRLSSRTYTQAFERKPKGDWQKFITERCFSQSNEQWVRVLERDPQFKTVADRVAEFVRRTGRGRSTYFALKKSLDEQGLLAWNEVPSFELTARPPQMPDPEAEAKAAAERARRQAEQQRLQDEEEREYRDIERRYFDDDDEADDQDANDRADGP